MMNLGWLGDELVGRLGGIDDNTNLNALNSLLGRPAAQSDTTESSCRTGSKVS